MPVLQSIMLYGLTEKNSCPVRYGHNNGFNATGKELKVLNIIPLANCKQNSCCVNFSRPKIFPAAWRTLTSATANRHWNTQHGPCWVFDASSNAIGWAHTSLVVLHRSWMIGIINFQSEWLATYSKLPKWQVPLVGCCVALHWGGSYIGSSCYTSGSTQWCSLGIWWANIFSIPHALSSGSATSGSVAASICCTYHRRASSLSRSYLGWVDVFVAVSLVQWMQKGGGLL